MKSGLFRAAFLFVALLPMPPLAAGEEAAVAPPGQAEPAAPTAPETPAAAPAVDPKMRDGLVVPEMEWRTLNAHKVDAGGAIGEIRVQCFVPREWQGGAGEAPIAFGDEIRFVFDLQPAAEERKVNLGFSLTVPRAGRKWLKPFAKSEGLEQRIDGANMTFTAPMILGEPWWLTLPVTKNAAAGGHDYAVSLGGAEAAKGSFSLADVSGAVRDDLQRKYTIYFFARVAHPRFRDWVEEHGGRMPTTKEFLRELESLEYFPANDYTAHRGMPRRYADIANPGTVWLAREVKPGADGRTVVVYADGTIGLGGTIDVGKEPEGEE